MTEQIVKALDELAEARVLITKIEQEKQALIDEVLTPEIKARIDDIESEIAPTIMEAQETVASFEGLIKERLLFHGESVDGTFLKAVFNKGRVKWDTKALDGYAKAHPELLVYRTQGKPYASIRGR